LVIDEAQKLSEEERQGIMMSHPRVLMVSVVDLTDDGYSFIYRIEDLTIEEVKSYINKYDSNGFDEGAKEEIAKASSGRPRLINLLCRTCLEISEKVDKNIVEQVAKKKYKLRY
jgi:Holliday junction resolvasome RuvABC ATP-dependent DNA helicase subunit